MNRAALPTILLTALFVGGAACQSAVGEDEVVGDTQAMSFDEFMEVVYEEPDTGVFIVNGDTPIGSYEELVRFYETHVQNGALIVHQSGGEDAVWSDTQKRNLTYCVSQKSFRRNYDRAVQAMEQAAAAWEAVADVDFVHDASKDGSCSATTEGVVFDVRQVRGGQYLARAFFPDSPRSQRNVLIDTSVYPYDDDPTDELKLAGVLRHELGHALGFRHEHTRPESGACFEDNNWRPLTDYDQASVMHYPQCSGISSWALELTTTDAQGAADLYGTPNGGGSGGAGAGGGTGGAGAGGGDTGGEGGSSSSSSSSSGGACFEPEMLCGNGSCGLPVGASCVSDSDCCFPKCKGKEGSKTCR